MKKLLIAAVLLGFAGLAQAETPNPFLNAPNPFEGARKPIFKSVFHKQPLPAFQAAPWYLYFPYNGHFQTPAPMAGAPFYAPPGGGYQANPYFPQGPAPMYMPSK